MRVPVADADTGEPDWLRPDAAFGAVQKSYKKALLKVHTCNSRSAASLIAHLRHDQIHPDKAAGDATGFARAKATEMFKVVSAAYQKYEQAASGGAAGAAAAAGDVAPTSKRASQSSMY